MHISRFSVNPFGENVYVAWNDATRNSFVIDPGMMTVAERQLVFDFLTEHDLNVKMILLTHAHVDHAASANWLAGKACAKIFLNAQDDLLASHLQEQATMFGLSINQDALAAHEAITDGQILKLDDDPIMVIATPGHTPGSVSYYLKNSDILFSGDTIFKCSVGRTDLPGGSHAALINSIRNHILTLPTDTRICPGHGATTSVGNEIASNPYC